MQHHFSTVIAKKYTVNIAILLDNFLFWYKSNKAKHKNFHEGAYWTYGTPEFFQEYFDYLTVRQIRYMLDQAVKNDLLKKGRFNKKKYDKTNWYALTEKALILLGEKPQPLTGLICQNCQIHLTKLSDPFDKNGEPIPDTKTDTKLKNKNSTALQPCINENKEEDYLSKNETNNSNSVKNNQGIKEKTTSRATAVKNKPSLSVDDLMDDNPHDIPKESLEDHLEVRKKKRSPMTRTAWKEIKKQLDMIKEKGGCPIEAFNHAISRGWIGFKSEWLLKQDNYKATSELDFEDTSWIKDIHKNSII